MERPPLRRSETKFRTLYDSTGDAVMLLDEKGFFGLQPGGPDNVPLRERGAIHFSRNIRTCLPIASRTGAFLPRKPGR